MPQETNSRRRNVSLWIVRVLVATAFLAAGSAKLAGVPAMVSVFDHVGIGQWFRYATGGIEVIGALLVLSPLAGFGSILLAVTMVGAVISHLLRVPGSPVPALILFSLSLVIAWAFRERTLKWGSA